MKRTPRRRDVLRAEKEQRAAVIASFHRLVGVTCREIHGGPNWTETCRAHGALGKAFEGIVNGVADIVVSRAKRRATPR